MAEENMQQLQLYEQSLQTLLSQKQQFQAQAGEISSALEELKSATESYRIIGNIMVRTEKEKLREDLEEKDAALRIRVKALEKQEAAIKEKAAALREKVMASMKDEK